jgi:ribosomal protein S18 acetylase RimI-like enzyme
MHTVSLRPATPADAGAVAKLGADVFSATFGHTVTQEQLDSYLNESYSIEAMVRDIEDAQKDLIVATSADGTVQGFALLTRGSSEPCVEHVQDKAELQRIYVDAKAHGLGIGKKLIIRLEDIAREQGFKYMWLGVWEENHKARSVYERQGYRRVGEHDFDVGGDIQTDHILLKEL